LLVFSHVSTHPPACLPRPQVLAISKGGLERRGLQETKYLKELEAIAESGITQVGQPSGWLVLASS
jgi:hypothetical protein